MPQRRPYNPSQPMDREVRSKNFTNDVLGLYEEIDIREVLSNNDTLSSRAQLLEQSPKNLYKSSD